MSNRYRRYQLTLSLVALVLFRFPLGVVPQAKAAGNPNQFGGQDRAAAASEMIVLGVQQGISSLPPTSGQSFVYQFDPASDTYVRGEQLGPTSFRSPQTVGPGKFSFRLATSYFELADTKAPIPYLVSRPPGTPLGVGALGLQADAKVGLVNFSANYGFTNRIEVTMNLPVVVVNASAKQIFTTSQPSGPPLQAPFSGTSIVTDSAGKPDLAASVGLLNQAIRAGAVHLRKESLSDLGFGFNDGTHAGVGRISVGVKGVLYADKIVQLAAAPEFYCPSPNQADFAGSDSAAILPRLVAGFRLADAVRLHVDAGYDYDFDKDELRRFVWNLGPSLALGRATLDTGVGGSKFNTGIKWTPTTAPFVDSSGNPGSIQA